MRILDFYSGCVLASTTFITLAVFVSACFGGVIKFFAQVKGY